MQVRALLALLVAPLLLVGCDKPPTRKATPAVWVVRDADTVLYLTGTVHLLPDDIDWRNGPIVAAMADAQELITELSPAELDRVAQVAPSYFTGPNSIAPVDRFDPPLRAAFLKLAADDLLDRADAAKLDDWALALMLARSVAAEAGLDGRAGMDNGLIAEFGDAGKLRRGMESAADQFAQFDAIPSAEQRIMLNRLMQEIAAGNADDRLFETITAWRRGDVDALAEIVARDAKIAPATHKLMLVDRNRRWTEWIVQRMRKPGRTLVAVGAAHLAGPESLPAILATRGLEPQRMN